MPWPSYPKSPTLPVSSSPGHVVQFSGTLGAKLQFSESSGTKLQLSESSGTKLQFSETATVLLQCRLLRRVSGATVSSSPANWDIYREVPNFSNVENIHEFSQILGKDCWKSLKLLSQQI
ncbi:hypothetical protein LXL04_017522 [Taraxacum kok-saghyz]